MNSIFNSYFAEQLDLFVIEKQSLGFKYLDTIYVLKRFDKFVETNFPNETNLSENLCLAWAKTLSKNTNNSIRSQLSVLREFAKFLIRNQYNAYIIPINFIRRDIRPTPYIYTENEISIIWKAFDSIKLDKRSPGRHIVLPAVVRILYCCGLRPAETRNLMTEDVDLTNGKLFIRESKKHKDRIVMLKDDVRDYLLNFNDIINIIIPNRIFFFPQSVDKPYSKMGLFRVFNKIKIDIGLPKYCQFSPRIYDFRHTFATHRLYKWLEQKKDLTAYLPYLSAYMGHGNLTDTYYYISLVPEQFKIMSGLDFSKYEDLLPEVEFNE
jgi:integrase